MKAQKPKKVRETLKSLRWQISYLKESRANDKDRAYAEGYNAGRLYVTNTLRDLVGIDKL